MRSCRKKRLPKKQQPKLQLQNRRQQQLPAEVPEVVGLAAAVAVVNLSVHQASQVLTLGGSGTAAVAGMMAGLLPQATAAAGERQLMCLQQQVQGLMAVVQALMKAQRRLWGQAGGGVDGAGEGIRQVLGGDLGGPDEVVLLLQHQGRMGRPLQQTTLGAQCNSPPTLRLLSLARARLRLTQQQQGMTSARR